MKHLVLLMLLLVSFSASAFELNVYKMKALKGMDRSFQLYTKSIPEQMVLDCQSFVQGLTIGEMPNETFFFLDPQECEDLYGRIYQSLKKRQNHCLDVGESIYSDYPCNN